jgi:hypothetical protein
MEISNISANFSILAQSTLEQTAAQASNPVSNEQVGSPIESCVAE